MTFISRLWKSAVLGVVALNVYVAIPDRRVPVQRSASESRRQNINYSFGGENITLPLIDPFSGETGRRYLPPEIDTREEFFEYFWDHMENCPNHGNLKVKDDGLDQIV